MVKIITLNNNKKCEIEIALCSLNFFQKNVFLPLTN